MDHEIDELKEYLLYSEFLEVMSEAVFDNEDDQYELNISDESDEDDIEDDERMEDDETDRNDIDIMQCIINMIEIEYVLQNECPKKRRKGERRWGVHPLNQMRREQGHFNNLFKEMLVHDHDQFFNYTRMTPERFEHLFGLIETKITKTASNAIPPKCRLLLTLRYFEYSKFEVNC